MDKLKSVKTDAKQDIDRFSGDTLSSGTSQNGNAKDIRKLEKKIQFNKKKFQLNTYEIEILKKISEWPKCVDLSSSKLEPHRIPFYLYELVTLFHSYWNLGKDNKEFRFVTDRKDLNFLRLALLQALSIVIKNGMSILGVSTPRSM